MIEMNDPTVRTHDDALALLRALMQAAQKSRSNMRESMGEGASAEIVLRHMSPWLFGPKSVLPPLIKHVTRAEAGEPISGSELFNWVLVATRFEPAIGLTVALYAPRFRDITEPNMSWIGQTWTR